MYATKVFVACVLFAGWVNFLATLPGSMTVVDWFVFGTSEVQSIASLVSVYMYK